MVEVEIRAALYNAEAETVESTLVALVTADGSSLTIEPVDAWAVPIDPVVSLSSGKSVDPEQDPEEWARNLPYAYRGGDIVAVLRHDDDPPATDVLHEDETEAEPEIPAPTRAEFGSELLAN